MLWQKVILFIMEKKCNFKKIKALAIDLDGTMLMPEAVLGERTARVLKRIISNGMQIVISTGRADESSERYYSAIGAEGPMIFFNGAKVVDVPSGKLISGDFVDMDVLDYALDLARELKVHFQIYLQSGISPDTGESDPERKWETLLMDRPASFAEMYQRHTGIKAVITDLKKVFSLPGVMNAVKGMFIADPSLHDEIRMRMNNRYGDRINITRSLSTFLELLKNGVSKGEGLKTVMKHRGLIPEEVIAIGDDENDLSMLEVAGFAVVPLNAKEEIREAADLVIGSNTEEGLAAFLEETF
jgi:Cof subfamily protein (haloacid dehalogenase superfamily)